jgi:acetyl esterase/lipase
MSENTGLAGMDLEALEKLPLTLEISETIIGAIQNAIYKGKTINSFEPLQEPRKAVKANGQYVVTEIRYGTRFMNSYLDITYPTEDTTVRRPTVIYTHGGGFFGGSKTVGDPLAAGDGANAVFEEIVGAGYNFVNVDYVLLPEGHFPDQLMQLTEAVDFLAAHAGEYGLDMENVVVMGSSAGAILTGQYGALLASPAYRSLLGIEPKISPDAVKCLVIDDCPFQPKEFNWKMKVMTGAYLGTVDMDAEIAQKTNAYAFFNRDLKPCFFDAGPKDGFPEDMAACGELLTSLGVENEVFIPENRELPHGFLNLMRFDAEAAEAVRRIIAFMDRYTK